MFRPLFLALLLVTGICQGKIFAEEALPPAPQQYVTDEAVVIAPAVVAQLNQRLAEFEKAT